MGIHSISDLNEMHVSVLSEIGNIGCGNAATALSRMLDMPVDMSTPEVGIANYNEAFEKLGGPETVMVGLLLSLKSDMSGMLMFLMPGDTACEIINMMAYTELKDYTEIDEMGFSAISEMANIMSAAFANAVANMAGMVIDISPPSYAIDMLGALLSLPAAYYAKIGDLFMYIKNELVISGKKMPANILLLPEVDSLNKLMVALGLE